MLSLLTSHIKLSQRRTFADEIDRGLQLVQWSAAHADTHFIGLKSVHFHQQLVQGLAGVVLPMLPVTAPQTAHPHTIFKRQQGQPTTP
jgi:hypothetical protein